VHFGGLPCDMDAITDIAASHQLQVIEDCAHAVEASYRGRPAGTLGDYGCFSFYATKSVTSGEGGMVLAKDADKMQRLRIMSLHGMSRDAWNRFSGDGYLPYQVGELGFKYNMMDLQAAIGIHQLRRVMVNLGKRQKRWQQYQQAFAALPVTCPVEAPHHVQHGCHLYTLLVDAARCGISRDQFLTRMTAMGIGVSVHYLSLTEHPYYKQRLGWKSEDTPVATRIGQQTVSLPLTAKLCDRDVERVIAAVGKALQQ